MGKDVGLALLSSLLQLAAEVKLLGEPKELLSLVVEVCSPEHGPLLGLLAQGSESAVQNSLLQVNFASFMHGVKIASKFPSVLEVLEGLSFRYTSLIVLLSSCLPILHCVLLLSVTLKCAHGFPF